MNIILAKTNLITKVSMKLMILILVKKRAEKALFL